MVDVILDTAGQKGAPGEMGFAERSRSRRSYSHHACLEGRLPVGDQTNAWLRRRYCTANAGSYSGDREAFLTALRNALRLAMLTVMRARFRPMHEASKEYGYNLDLQEIARI